MDRTCVVTEKAPVKIDSSHKFGAFANAFRVVEEVGPDCFLDFLVYSAVEKEATVVARVRVRREFLPAIKNNLHDALDCFTASKSLDAAPNNIVFSDPSGPLN